MLNQGLSEVKKKIRMSHPEYIHDLHGEASFFRRSFMAVLALEFTSQADLALDMSSEMVRDKQTVPTEEQQCKARLLL